jgi:hypothetical protein
MATDMPEDNALCSFTNEEATGSSERPTTQLMDNWSSNEKETPE